MIPIVMMMVVMSLDRFSEINELVHLDHVIGMGDVVVYHLVLNCLLVQYRCNLVVNNWSNHRFVVLDGLCCWFYYLLDRINWFLDDVRDC